MLVALFRRVTNAWEENDPYLPHVASRGISVGFAHATSGARVPSPAPLPLSSVLFSVALFRRRVQHSRHLSSLKGITLVQTKEHASKVLDQLMALPAPREFAVDTEVAHIDVTEQSPVGNGTVICASVFAGPDVDFGTGPSLWIDNLDEAEGTLDVFKPFLEATHKRKVQKRFTRTPRRFAQPLSVHVTALCHDNRIMCASAVVVWMAGQVYHNYGFDRHVLFNHGINAVGFAGDTMHMARLWSASRAKGGFSLESLTDELLHRRCARVYGSWLPVWHIPASHVECVTAGLHFVSGLCPGRSR
jgi:hypothetical protein